MLYDSLILLLLMMIDHMKKNLDCLILSIKKLWQLKEHC